MKSIQQGCRHLAAIRTGLSVYFSDSEAYDFAKQILVRFSNSDQCFNTDNVWQWVRQGRTYPFMADLICAYILEQENLTLRECIMVGDRQYDIMARVPRHLETIASELWLWNSKELVKRNQLCKFPSSMNYHPCIQHAQCRT